MKRRKQTSEELGMGSMLHENPIYMYRFVAAKSSVKDHRVG
jgi:hypothetical protein